MLKSLDILIGFSVIMLAASMSITVIIQWIVHLLGLRGRELRQGLAALLRQLEPELLTEEHAAHIATRILTHPMLARGGEKLAATVQREQLIQIVLEIGSEADGPAPGIFPTPPQVLARALGRLGIPQPGATLNAVRMLSLRLAGSMPDVDAELRESMATIGEAESLFAARIHACFDPAMDRVSQSFTSHSRYWTAAVSLFLALLLQMDAFRIVNRLAIDAPLRASLVQAAVNQTAAAPDGRPQDNLAQLRLLAGDPLLTWPHGWNSWRSGWQQSSVFGILLSATMLSLGAPFWFHVLGDLIRLRPVAASKNRQARRRRASPPPAIEEPTEPLVLTES